MATGRSLSTRCEERPCQPAHRSYSRVPSLPSPRPCVPSFARLVTQFVKVMMKEGE